MTADPDDRQLDFERVDRLLAERAVRQASESMRERPDMRFVARQAGQWAAFRFLAGAAFPRLTRRLGWPRRLGPRGLLMYTVANAVGAALLRSWAMPHLREQAVEAEVGKQQLRRTLGREPTEEELVQHLMDERERERNNESHDR